MTLEAQGARYSVKFWYEPHRAGESRMTTCLISTPTDRTLGVGVALCSPRDQFEKFTGRKIALARALHAARLPRDERRQLWESFFAQVGRYA